MSFLLCEPMPSFEDESSQLPFLGTHEHASPQRPLFFMYFKYTHSLLYRFNICVIYLYSADKDKNFEGISMPMLHL